ncbi:MAG: hypothetical protein JEZ06_00365 [Anaerolineaceae bacterium]|nr:hypothetical protein [Anaerolineaceae bacterium]
MTITKEELMDNLLGVFTPTQIQQLVDTTKRISDGPGYGDVIITINNRSPRFIGIRTSEDFKQDGDIVLEKPNQ